ncbi:MAG TPA: type VI secretion system contractile sheath large subunit, partial [Gemmatimonadales bacterium]|nr:type VI secretion system contractile sheath large subunit [Gemmatimonadales bacterium]
MSDFHLDITAGRDRSQAQPLDDTPFRIALIGDWSGRGSRGVVDSPGKIAARQPHSVDRDDLEDAMEDLGVELALQVEGNAPPLVIRFRSLDDFHPDQLYARLQLFEALRNLPTAFPRKVPQAGLLDDILAEVSPADANEAIASSEGDLHKFLQTVLKGHLVPGPDARETERKAQIAAAAGTALRAILHHPRFQELEANWRAADLLARRIDTSSQLRLELIDLTRAELNAVLPAGQDPQQSPLYAMLTRQSQSAPWSLLASAHSLGGDPADIERAAQLAAIGHLLN